LDGKETERVRQESKKNRLGRKRESGRYKVLPRLRVPGRSGKKRTALRCKKKKRNRKEIRAIHANGKEG